MNIKTISVMAVLATAALPAHGYLINGDFEASPFADGWSVVGATVTSHPGLTAGSTTAAFIPANVSTGGDLVQNLPNNVDYVFPPSTSGDEFSPTGPIWQLGFNFAAVAPTGSNRTVNLVVGHDVATTGNWTPQISFRITANGAASAYNGSAWAPVLDAGTVKFSNLEGSQFQDPTVYLMQINGDYSSANPFYTVSIQEVGSSDVITSSAIEAWQYGVPNEGDGIIRLRFHGNGGNDAPYAIDNVSLIPEPSTYAAIFGLGALGVAMIRRRRSRKA